MYRMRFSVGPLFFVAIGSGGFNSRLPNIGTNRQAISFCGLVNTVLFILCDVNLYGYGFCHC